LKYLGRRLSLAAFFFHPLRARLQALADRFFYGGWYDYQSVEALRRDLAGASLCPGERALLSCPRASLWVPLRAGTAVWGALVLGPKLGTEPFNATDRRILETLARQMALVADRLALQAETERLYRALVLSHEEERKRLACDLHDEVVQEITALQRTLEAWPRQPLGQVETNLKEARKRLRRLLDRVRGICAELRPAALDLLGLVETIRSEAEIFAARSGLRLRLELTGDEAGTLPEAVQVCLYRVFQEALGNVEKHAYAERVEVTLHMGSEEVRLVVRDDGQGFRLPPRLGLLMDKGHFGLAGMRERLDMLGGRLEISSRPGWGTKVVAMLPGLDHWRSAPPLVARVDEPWRGF
jgi:signal transduction histidine kinase